MGAKGKVGENEGAGAVELPEAAIDAALAELVAMEIGPSRAEGGEEGETGTGKGARETEREEASEEAEAPEGEPGAEAKAGADGDEAPGGEAATESEEKADDGAPEEQGKSAEDGEAEEESAEEAPEERLSKRAQAKVDRRIGKLVSQRKALEAEVAALKAELTTVKSGQAEAKGSAGAGQSPFGRLAKARTAAEVEAAVDEAWQVKRWCEEHSDGGMSGETEVTPEQVRQIRLNAEEAIHRHAPARRQYLGQETQFNAEAKRIFPWMEKDGEELPMVSQVVSAFPAIKEQPDWKLTVGYYLTGLLAVKRQQEQAAAQKAGASAGQKRPVKQPLGARGGPSREGRAAEQKAALRQRALAAGTEDALASYLETAL